MATPLQVEHQCEVLIMRVPEYRLLQACTTADGPLDSVTQGM